MDTSVVSVVKVDGDNDAADDSKDDTKEKEIKILDDSVISID